TLANQWNVNTIDTKSDSIYKANQFTRAFRNVYESIHGSLLATEYDRLTESSLELNYNLNGVQNGGASDSLNGRVAWVENIDPSGPKDISYYNQMRFALFVKDRSSDGNEEFIYRFGRDAANYYEVRIPLKNIDRKYSPTQANYWHEYTIHLHARTPEEKKNLDARRGGNLFALSHRSNSTLAKNTAVGEEAIALLDGAAYTVTKKGVPTLFDASYTALGVQNTDPSATRSGSIWVDEMYLNDDQLQFGQSYRMNLAFSKKTPIRINETEVVSEIKASTSFTHDGLNFSSIDKTTGNQSQRESVAFATSFKLLRSLGFSYEGLRDYNVSQYDENLLPKENQIAGETSVDRVSFNLTIPGLIGEWIPSLSHTLSKNHSRSLSFLITNTNVDFDSQNLQAKDLETSIKSYSISENKVFKFGNNFSIGQNYTIGMDVTRTISMSTNVQRSATSVFSEDKYLWFPIASLIGQNATNRSPAFGAFPNANAPVTDKKNWLNLLDYQYRRSQSFSLDFSLFDFRLSVGHSSAETHYLSLSNASDPSLTKIAQTFEPETTYTSWYEFYWPELRSIFQDSFIPGKSIWTGKERRYNLSLDYGKPLVIFQIPILSRIGITASYNYTESDFR
ncbi:MAG: hypothetical protein JNM63_18540, partial [Spirochaetia bacterium]|nr:hypothetical protein [Spirochaetia bacterium]